MTEPHDLDEIWRVLAQPEGPLLEARRVTTWPGGDVLAAVDDQQRRHLLVAVPRSSGNQPIPRSTSLQGVDVSERRMRVAGREANWIDVVLLDPDGTVTFTVLCADIAARVGTADRPDPGVVVDVIDRWRRFWAVKAGDLTLKTRIGLFGELWFLTRWLPAVNPTSIRTWQGPLGGRHDFATATASVEVKTSTASTGPVIHRISGLAQLDPPQDGELFLLSLRVVAEPAGRENLDALVRAAQQAADRDGHGARDALDDRLAALGWKTAHRGRYTEPLRVDSQSLYRVADDFPRLTPGRLPTIPAGITAIRYDLDTSACHHWLVADAPPTAAKMFRHGWA